MGFNYLSFGYIPTGNFLPDLMGRCLGARNLFKRLQARTILDLVDPKNEERILDFGCGSGFFAFEFARRGAHAVGLDIIDLPKGGVIENGRIEFVKLNQGNPIPFPKNYFEKIFLSEVLVVLSDAKGVLMELYEKLQTGGQMIIVNTLGRKQIEEAYQRNGLLIQLFKKFYPHCPPSYDDFCSHFFRMDGLNRNRWYPLEEIQSFLKEAGFVKIRILFPFKELPFLILYWLQFLKLSARKALVLKFGIFRYLALEFIKVFGKRYDPSNAILIGEKS